MSRRETPQRWRELMETNRLHSARDLAAAMNVSTQTALRMMHGEQTSAETIAAAAVALKVEPAVIYELRGETQPQPFALPLHADRLTAKQRAAVLAVVRAMLEPTDDAPIAPEDPEVEAIHEQARAEMAEETGLRSVPKGPSRKVRPRA